MASNVFEFEDEIEETSTDNEVLEAVDGIYGYQFEPLAEVEAGVEALTVEDVPNRVGNTDW